ncbi:MAG: transcriptional regulator, XRE family [uncultured bacterium]|nr:MAG: transcriptional regulator, XRE family [uncultured bacterium]
MFSSNNLKEFGTNLKSIRTKNKLSQKQVYNLSHISEETLRRIENGLVIPRYDTLEILSSIYKIDLLNVLMNSRAEVQLIEIYNYLDLVINTSDISMLNHLKAKLDILINESLSLNLINKNEMTLFKDFINCSIEYYANDNKEVLLTKLEESLKLSIPNFNIKSLFTDSFFEIVFTPLDIRYFILIALSLISQNRISESTKILKHCLNYLREIPTHSYEIYKLELKVYFNISYNYHRLNDYNKALLYANLGIELAFSHQLIYCLPHLYLRKGIAEFRLNITHYQSTLVYSIELLLMQKEDALAKLYLKILHESYNINLSCRFDI